MTKILKFLTETGTAFGSLAPLFKGLLIFSVLVALYLGVAGHNTKSNLDQFRDTYSAYQKGVDTLLKHIKDSTDKQIAAHQHTAVVATVAANKAQNQIAILKQTLPSKDSVAKLESQIDSLKHAITDSVELARVVIPKQDTVIKKQDTTITNLTQQNAFFTGESESLRTALTQKTAIIDIQKGSIDTLTNKLKKLPAPPKAERFLGILPLPDRKTSAALGATGGILLTIYTVIQMGLHK